MKARWLVIVSCVAALPGLGCHGRSGGPDDAACQSDGILSTRTLTRAEGGELAAEIVQSGCRDCAAQVRPGAVAGSACSAASVCAETCCECPDLSQKAHYRARVCDSGRCAAPALACAASRTAIRPDVCAAPLQSSPRNSSTAMP